MIEHSEEEIQKLYDFFEKVFKGYERGISIPEGKRFMGKFERHANYLQEQRAANNHFSSKINREPSLAIMGWGFVRAEIDFNNIGELYGFLNQKLGKEKSLENRKKEAYSSFKNLYDQDNKLYKKIGNLKSPDSKYLGKLNKFLNDYQAKVICNKLRKSKSNPSDIVKDNSINYLMFMLESSDEKYFGWDLQTDEKNGNLKLNTNRTLIQKKESDKEPYNEKFLIKLDSGLISNHFKFSSPYSKNNSSEKNAISKLENIFGDHVNLKNYEVGIADPLAPESRIIRAGETSNLKY